MGDAEVGWPRTPEQLGGGKEARAALEGVIARLPEAKRAALMDKVKLDMAARWGRYAGGVREAKALEGAFAAMKDYGVDEAGLEPRLKYDWMVWGLKKSAQSDATDQQVIALVKAFDKDVRGLGATASAPGVSKLLSGIAPIARAEEPKRPVIDPKTLGPGSAKGGWVAKLDPGTGDLSFTRGSTVMTFVRVEFGKAKDGEDAPAVYLATRELSIGDAAEILDAGGGIAEFKKDLPPWAGPRGWMVDARAGLVPQGGWIQVDANMTQQLPGYAPEILQPGQVAKVAAAAGGEPTRDHPMQAVPPTQLAYIARLAGCRFPTSAEWAAAHAKLDGGATPAGSNLRDATFEKQRQHVKQARATPGLTRQDSFAWPDLNAFAPVSGTKPAVGEKATVRPENDGVLWFAPGSIGGGERVHHLIGNVWELVVEDGTKFERTAPTNMQVVDTMLGKEKLEVIGGSALSAPEIPIDRPQLVDLGDASEGYADVGCRLAFNATGTPPPRETFAMRLGKLLTDDTYLLAP